MIVQLASERVHTVATENCATTLLPTISFNARGSNAVQRLHFFLAHVSQRTMPKANGPSAVLNATDTMHRHRHAHRRAQLALTRGIRGLMPLVSLTYVCCAMGLLVPPSRQTSVRPFARDENTQPASGLPAALLEVQWNLGTEGPLVKSWRARSGKKSVRRTVHPQCQGEQRYAVRGLKR